MNRELAKELKAGGFPAVAHLAGHAFYPNEKSPGWTDFARSQGVTITHYELENRPQDIKDGYVCPSLSDLLEACGDRFARLYVVKAIWFAESDDPQTVARGDSPEEAVAKLWFMLNKSTGGPDK
jgi:hypothetical protein